jgi:hypothetical protein
MHVSLRLREHNIALPHHRVDVKDITRDELLEQVI